MRAVMVRFADSLCAKNSVLLINANYINYTMISFHGAMDGHS